MFPLWAKIDHDFDQNRIKQELLSNKIFDKAMVATTIYNHDNKSVWDPEGKLFGDLKFAKQTEIHRYELQEGEKVLVNGTMNTFNMLNLTMLPEIDISNQDSWEGSLEKNDRIPLWIKYKTPWTWREDLDISYTRQVIEALPIEYPLTIRCIIQAPPSIGVVHKDSGPKTNRKFFSEGYASITLNIADGGANLYFINYKNGKRYQVDESKHKAWHFDDSCTHCTSEVQSERIQLRVFAKLKKPYFTFLKHQDMVF
jgi:hypothetical protein